MNILDKIIVDKRREVILKKSIIPVSQLEASVFSQKRLSLSENLKIVPLELLLNISVVQRQR
jgi:indole-3-glycerol phosphate synthase